jgi:ribosomal 50S subunit-recycling heat shock protein
MRLDKYLKVSRLIKRRTVANDACDTSRITVNGKIAKASYNVKLGDLITVAFGTKSVTVRVLDIKETTKKAESAGMYEVVSESDE